MKKLIRTFVIVICSVAVFLSTTTNLVYAQSMEKTATDKYYWINVGFGLGSIGEDGGGGSGGINISYQFGKNILSLRTMSCGLLFGKILSDYGLLYGLASKSSSFHDSFGIGVALVNGIISHGLFSSKEPEKIGPTIGLPVEVQLFWRPLKVFGIGLYGFANLNPEESFYGVTLSFQLGKLR